MILETVGIKIHIRIAVSHDALLLVPATHATCFGCSENLQASRCSEQPEHAARVVWTNNNATSSWLHRALTKSNYLFFQLIKTNYIK